MNKKKSQKRNESTQTTPIRVTVPSEIVDEITIAECIATRDHTIALERYRAESLRDAKNSLPCSF